jgi:hypothetical protein
MNPPLKNPNDAAKYRQQYISSLRLMASNNQKNYNANKIYAATGQSPSVLPDTRSSTEVIADTEGLRGTVRSKLLEITDSTNAGNIAVALTPDQLEFVIQAFPTIKEDITSKFALGVPAAIFLPYIRKLMGKYAQVDFVEYGLQQETGEAILLSNQQILGDMVNRADLENLRRQLDTIGNTNNSELNALRESVLAELVKIQRSIPTATDLQIISNISNMEQKANIQQLLNASLESIPTKEDLIYLQRGLITAITNNNAIQIEAALMGLANVLATTGGERVDMETIRTRFQKEPATPSTPSSSRNVVPVDIPEFLSLAEFSSRLKADKYAFLKSRKDAGELEGYVFSSRTTVPELNRIYTEWVDKKYPDGYVPMKGTGVMKGTGLKQPRGRKPVAFADKLKTEYIEPKKAYAQLGKFFINEERLINDSVLMLRNKDGKPTTFPSVRISVKLAKIIKKLIKQVSPDFEEINNLTEEDKLTLHKILRVTKLAGSGIAIDPIKSKDDRELENFDILKGQIVAGNNNPKLIKEFKTKLLAYMEAGRIPKRQGLEILQELVGRGLL